MDKAVDKIIYSEDGDITVKYMLISHRGQADVVQADVFYEEEYNLFGWEIERVAEVTINSVAAGTIEEYNGSIRREILNFYEGEGYIHNLGPMTILADR